MRKVLVVLAILLIAIPAMAKTIDTSAGWNYYKGVGGDGWGVMPTFTGSASWSEAADPGSAKPEFGTLWKVIDWTAGTGAAVSFDLQTLLPSCIPGGGEFTGNNFWSEVYVTTTTAAHKNDNWGATIMAGGAGSWIDKYDGVHIYNGWWNMPGGNWHTVVRWENASGGNYSWGQWDNDNTPIMNNQSFLKTIAMSQGEIVIGIKTGAVNYNSKGYEYHQTVSNVVVTPEPSSLLALGSGLFGLVGFAIRRRK